MGDGALGGGGDGRAGWSRERKGRRGGVSGDIAACLGLLWGGRGPRAVMGACQAWPGGLSHARTRLADTPTSRTSTWPCWASNRTVSELAPSRQPGEPVHSVENCAHRAAGRRGGAPKWKHWKPRRCTTQPNQPGGKLPSTDGLVAAPAHLRHCCCLLKSFRPQGNFHRRGAGKVPFSLCYQPPASSALTVLVTFVAAVSSRLSRHALAAKKKADPDFSVTLTPQAAVPSAQSRRHLGRPIR